MDSWRYIRKRDPITIGGHRSDLFRREESNSNPSLAIPIVTRHSPCLVMERLWPLSRPRLRRICMSFQLRVASRPRRTHADGTNPVKLTNGKNDRGPACSADGKWVYYWDLALQQLWRVPVDGSGKPEILPGSAVPRTIPTGTGLSHSPDGKLLAYVLATMPTPEDPYPQYKVALLELSSTPSPPRLIDADERISSGGLDLTPDGKAVDYPIRENGVDNLWLQPLDGSRGRQITSFDAEQILNFRWSPDGRSLCILRGHTDSDVVLLRESSP